MSSPKYLQQEEALSQEHKDLISSLPREKGWLASHMYQYQGFWYQASDLPAVISTQKHFQAQDSDILLVTNPKSGTTWLKAIIFTLLNRKHHPLGPNHPLLTHNPHDLVLSLEVNLYAGNQIPNIASFPSPSFFNTHIPYASLPETVKTNSSCKLVYVGRNPKDTFVSLWHFMNKLRGQEVGARSVEEDFEMFAKGLSLLGPFWDHLLQYWKRSKEDPDRVFFLKYEDMKEQPRVYLRRLAEFLGCPFTAEEEELGLVEKIIELTSFESMSGLEVNKNGTLPTGFRNEDFFRRGEVGDWRNHLSAEMAEKLDRIVEEKFFGSGLEL